MCFCVLVFANIVYMDLNVYAHEMHLQHAHPDTLMCVVCIQLSVAIFLCPWDVDDSTRCMYHGYVTFFFCSILGSAGSLGEHCVYMQLVCTSFVRSIKSRTGSTLEMMHTYVLLNMDYNGLQQT